MEYHYLWPEVFMPLLHLILVWIVSALALWIVARIIPGIEVRNFWTALVATAMIAIVDFTIGWLVRIVVLPLIILTFGLFQLAVNAFLLKVASLFTPGFKVRGILNAVLGSLVLTILTSLLRQLVF
ncbi:MAG: phage holin family protein [Bryobacteraceae bacterium]|jgi:putative membrane protein